MRCLVVAGHHVQFVRRLAAAGTWRLWYVLDAPAGMTFFPVRRPAAMGATEREGFIALGDDGDLENHVMRRGRIELYGSAVDLRVRIAEVEHQYLSTHTGTV
jgi:hypothetical protein